MVKCLDLKKNYLEKDINEGQDKDRCFLPGHLDEVGSTENCYRELGLILTVISHSLYKRHKEYLERTFSSFHASFIVSD